MSKRLIQSLALFLAGLPFLYISQSLARAAIADVRMSDGRLAGLMGFAALVPGVVGIACWLLALLPVKLPRILVGSVMTVSVIFLVTITRSF